MEGLGEGVRPGRVGGYSPSFERGGSGASNGTMVEESVCDDAAGAVMVVT